MSHPPAPPRRNASERLLRSLATPAALVLAASLAACGGPQGDEAPPASDPGETSESAAEPETASTPPKLSPDELAAIAAAGGYTFLDVRTSEEIRELGTFASHLHIPIDELEDRLAEIPPDLPVVTA